METIFDHNVTPDELTAVCGYAMTREEYLAGLGSDDAERFIDLLRLYRERGDEENVKKYYDLIPQPEQEKMWHVLDCVTHTDVPH